MSGSAPTPRLFGGDEAAKAENPRSRDMMSDENPTRRNILTGAGEGWWNQAPERTTYATTTGQNLEGSENAFDTKFWNESAKQDQEQSTQLGRWARPDATGIATYSYQPDRPELETERVKFGDVFVNGQVVGNMYEGYAGMTTADADEIMARLVLPREVWAAAYETEAGKPLTFAGSLAEEIKAAADQRSQDFTKGITAAAFEEGVAERSAELEDSTTAKTGVVAAGAGGGALWGAGVAGAVTAVTGGVGAVAAPFIIAGGAIAGGIGAWINRDESFRVYSQALEERELALEDGHTAVGYADAASGIAGLAMSQLNVSRNLLHGVYDAQSVGGIGDQGVAYQDQDTPLWMEGADFAALLVDGIGSVGSSAARKAFTTTMGASAASEAVSVGAGAFDGGTAFNPYSGSYEQLSAWGQAQRAASVGIDVAQTAAAGLVGRVANRLTGRGGAVSTGGHVVTTVAGGQQSARVGWSMLIPSEAAVGVTARLTARRSLLRAGEARTPEAIAIQTARQLEMLTTGRKTIATATVNGFGEGAEEFVQAVLGATAFGETPTFRELIDASKQGFAMGAGMGTAIGASSRSRSEMYRQRANTMRAFRNEEEWDTESWNGLTDTERAMAGTVSDAEEQRLYDLTVRELKRSGAKVATATFPELQRATEAARDIAEQELVNSQKLIESSRLQVRASHEWGPQDYVVSLGAAIDDISQRVQLLTDLTDGKKVAPNAAPLTPDQMAMVGLILKSDTALLQRLRSAEQQLMAAESTEQFDKIVNGVNKFLADLWMARDKPGLAEGEIDQVAFGARRSASVWGARYPLNSAGSFQLLRLQISPELTARNANSTVLVPDEILKPTGGDFDGDRFVNMLRQLIPEEEYQQLRLGAGLLTADGTMLDAKPYLIGQLELMADIRNDPGPGSLSFMASDETMKMIRARLGELLARTSMPVDVRRKLIGKFVQGFLNNDPGQVRVLFDTLSTQYSQAMRELGTSLNGSPYLVMNRIIEDEMRKLANALAMRDGVRSTTGLELPATSKNMPRWRPGRVRQPSRMADAAMQTGKYDIFRLQQVLKYNPRREAIETTPEETANVLAEFYRVFTARNDGIVRPGERAIFETTMAQERTISWLEGIAEEYQQALGTRTREEALVLLAGARVSDYDTPRRPRSDGDLLLIQAVLREVVTGLRSEYAELLGDAAVQQRLNALEGLTSPNFMVDDHTHAQGGDAFVEVLGAYKVTGLVGEQGANLAGFTVRSLRDYLMSLRWDVREQFIAAMHKHPSYTTEENAETPSPYRVLVDMVTESARMQLSEDRETGAVTGAKTVPSVTASRNFGELHDTIRKIANGRGQQITSAESARAFINSDLRTSAAVLSLLDNNSIRAGVVQRNENGELQKVEFPLWIYDVFAEPSTAKAEMLLLRQTLTMHKASLRTFDDDGTLQSKIDATRVNDRVLRVWLDLDYRASRRGSDAVRARAARDEFLRILQTSESVKEFEQRLNSDFRFRDERTPPFMAWARDRSLIEPDRFGKGVSDIQEGAEMRDALRDASKAAAAVLRDDEALRKYTDENATLISRLRESRDGVGDTVLFDRFKAWFRIARDLPTMVGSSVWIQQAAYINEIVGQMAVKGVAPENVDALGKAIAAQLPTFDAAAGRLIASMTSGSIASVLGDMTSLVRQNQTIVLNDGTVVEWAALTPETAVELLSNPNTAGMASRMLGMTAWDYNSDLGQNILTSIVGKGVAGFTADPQDSLFGTDTASKLRRLMVLEGMSVDAGGAPLIPVILAERMNVRETALDHVLTDKPGINGTERERMAVTELVDIADAMDKLSRIRGLYEVDGNSIDAMTLVEDDLDASGQPIGTGEQVTLLHRTLLRAGRKARVASGARSSVQRLLPAEPGPLRDAMYNVIQNWVAKFAADAVAADDKLRQAIAKKMTSDLNNIDDYTSPLDLLLSEYQDYTNPLTQQRVLTHALAYGDLAIAAPWARDVVLKAQKHPDQLTAKQWELLTRAVIAHTMHTTYGLPTSSETGIAVFPPLNDPDALAKQRSYWDPTFVESGLDIFAPGILRNPTAEFSPLLLNQLRLMRELFPSSETVTPDEAEKAVAKLIAPGKRNENGVWSGVSGHWHAIVPALMHSSVGAVLAASAESGIQMAGISPERLELLTATTAGDWSERPDDAVLSTATLTAAQLSAAVNNGEELGSRVDMQLYGASAPTTRPLAQLEGRVARSIVVDVPGLGEISLMGSVRHAPGLLLPAHTKVPAGEAGVINLDTLTQSITTLLSENRVPLAQWDRVSLNIQFFHPETKGLLPGRGDTNYSHNPWFDGVGAKTEAAYSQRSLLGTFFFGLSGTVGAAYATALDAMKNLSAALQQVTTMPEDFRQSLVNTGVTDMAQMLRELTEFALKQPIDGTVLPLQNYNAMYKLMSLLYVVRYIDENGIPQVLSSEDVIARQARGEGFPPDSFAQVVGLPLQHLLTLMGEPELSQYRMVAQPSGDRKAVPDISRALPYTRFPDWAWTDKAFGGLVRFDMNTDQTAAERWHTESLLDQPALLNQNLPRVMVQNRTGLDPRARIDTFGPYRKRQETIYSRRESTPAKWAEQRERVEKSLLAGSQNIGLQAFQAVQLSVAGNPSESAALLRSRRAEAVATNDFSTAWVYHHLGSRNGAVVDGVLTNTQEIGENAVIDDTVVVLADTFFQGDTPSLEDVSATATSVLRELMNTGTTIRVPVTGGTGAKLRRTMLQYLRENDYMPLELGADTYVPVAHKEETQAAAAFASMLNSATPHTSRNRVLIDLSLHNVVNENSIYEVNGGLEQIGTYDMRESIQTARYAGYAPVDRSTPSEMRAKTITTLLKVLSNKPGIDYLRKQAEVKGREQEAEFQRAVDRLRSQLHAAANDPQLELVPDSGDDFGTGDIIPLIGQNHDGELIGIHLLVHGHKPVTEAALRGALPEGNVALGADGVRLTIDRMEEDPMHTTHRGELVSRAWLGMQGFVATVRVKLSSLGAKVFEAGTGMKWTTTPAPKDLLIPSVKLFAGKPVLGAADMKSPASKTVDGFRLNTTGRIVESVGFSTLPYIVKLVTGVEYSYSNRGEYSAAEATVRETLEKFSDMYGGSLDPTAVVSRSTDDFTVTLTSLLETALNELLGVSDVDMNDLSTDERIKNIGMTRLVLTAIAAGASVDEVIGAPGYLGQPDGTPSHTMHPVFTTLLDQLPFKHPTRAAFVEQINARMNPDDRSEGYTLNPDFTWTRHVLDDNNVRYEIPAMLAFPELRATDTNDQLSELGAGRRQRASISPTTQAMAYTTWSATPMLERQLRGGSEVYDPNEYLHTGTRGATALYFGNLADSSPFIPRPDDDLQLRQKEWEHVVTRALPSRAALAVPIDQSGWYKNMSQASAKLNAKAYRDSFRDTLHLLKLTSRDSMLLTEMLRSVLDRPATDAEGEFMTYREAMAGLKLIQANARRHALPTLGGAVNTVSREALRRLREVGYKLTTSDGTRRTAGSWAEWVEIVLGETFSDTIGVRGYPAVSNIIDGLMYEYRKDVKGLPASVSSRLSNVLGLVQSQSGLIVTSPTLRQSFDSSIVQDGTEVRDLAELNTQEWAIETLPTDARQMVERRMTKWESKRGISRKRSTPRSEARKGVRAREDLARTNVLMRWVQLGYVAKTLVNLGLWISAFFEMGIRGQQERMTSFLSGESLQTSGLTPLQRKQWRDTVNALAESPAFYSQVYRNTNYQQLGGADSRPEQLAEHLTNRAAGAFNDPTWGTKAKILAESFLEASWDSASRFSTNQAITVEEFLNTAAHEGTDGVARISADAVAHGFARIEYRRNLQDNLLEITRRHAIEGFIGGGGAARNAAGVLLLRLPTMFMRFRSNTIINMFGLQAPHAVLAQLMSDRTKRPGGLKDHILGTTPDQDAEVTQLARIEDSYDLTRAIIRSGVSHTQLFVLGSVLSALGFGGEDDEEKLLNKLRRYQSPMVAKDPLALENDFRNAEAWFSDMLPAGMGVPTWIIRPFVSPAMGVARFAETGDFRQVYYGFADALGNLPLLNADTVLNSWEIANQLQAAAEAKSLEEGVEATAQSSKLLFTAVATLESMLFESAFASMLYQAADEYDRDPYKIAMTDSDGTIQRNALGLPRATEALTDYIDDEGNARQAYKTREDMDAYFHSLAENRPTLATVMSLIMQDSSYLRYNMVPKTREIDTEELTQEEAQQIVVSILNNETGAEEVTLDGAAGVIRGIHLGTIKLDDPSLNGVFIPDSMRMELQTHFLETLTEKYIKLDYSKADALNAAKEEYYGQAYGEPEAMGLADIIWNSAIPKYQTQEYVQLNTTYVMGPNGYPIATGLQRSVLSGIGLNVPGWGVFETFHDGTTSNMGVDNLLNSTDTVRGVNLGQRGLIKVDESWNTPTDVELAEMIDDSLKDIAERIDDLNDALDGGYGYGGYGGYGSGYGGSSYVSRADYGGQVQRLNTPASIYTPYALSPRIVNPSNPSIRRASIRRERFSSERGRLNQWQ